MPRTTSAAVQAVLTHDWDTETVLDPFIEAASSLVDGAVALAQDRSLTLANPEIVERWLSAHCYKYAADRQFKGRDVQGAVTGGAFEGQTAMALDGTTYGQMAMALDGTGCLRALSKGQHGSLLWAGKPPDEQIPYWERGW